MNTYDAELCERLAREAREDDERLGEWRYDAGSVRLSLRDHEGDERDDVWFRHHKDARAVVRSRNNLRAMADQLDAARAEAEDARNCHQLCEKDNVDLACQLQDVYKECNAAVAERDELRRTVERMGAVVEAAEKWRDAAAFSDDTLLATDLETAVDTYLENK